MNYNIDDLLYNTDKIVDDSTESAAVIQSRDYEDLKYDLQDKISSIFDKQGKIHFYGSRIFGFANENSDVDIFLDFEDSIERNYFCKRNRDYDGYFLEAIRDELIDDDNWYVSLFLPRANVPLLRARYIPENLNCDLIASNGIGVENSHLLRHLAQIQPEFRRLFFFIRMWLGCYGIRFKNYTLTLLVIFFLQRKNFMPTIERVQRNLEEKYIDGWNVAFDDQRSLCSYGTRKMRDYKNHIVDFFTYYGKYRFENYVISTHYGCSFLREKTYTFPNFLLNKPMCVAGLLSQDYNCSYDVSTAKFKSFINTCHASVKLLRSKGF